MAYELSYGERFKVVWFLTWRYLFIGFLVNVLVVIVTGFFSSTTTALSWLLCLPLYPVVIRMMLKKQFSTFRFKVVPVTEQIPKPPGSDSNNHLR